MPPGADRLPLSYATGGLVGRLLYLLRYLILYICLKRQILGRRNGLNSN